ncbi:hypothetical protein FUAX_17240 [Fulvitalea axinellae]|uniref:Thioredoxin domain-containing protein n=1 Tax=Fulvitalea axinellae TaxID=1182444 RepID=A0AAU9CV15_9BACT|nr:hypothetical protein FUAX_17240 [Fulvitalea axinellae]
MKLCHFSFLILLALAVSQSFGQTVIKGKLHGAVNQTVRYADISAKANFPLYCKKTKTDSKGNFRITLNTESPTFFWVAPEKAKLNYMIVKPDGKYKVEFGQEGENFKIKGTDAELNTFYSNLPHQALQALKKLGRDGDIHKKAKAKKVAEYKALDSLTKLKKLSQEVLNAIKRDRALFYAEQDILLSIRSPEPFKTVGEALRLANDPQYKTCVAFLPLTESIIKAKVRSDKSYSREKMRALAKQGKAHTFTVNTAKKYFEEPVKEAFIAYYIHERAFQKRFEKELVSLFDEFKQSYPASSFTPHVQPLVSKIEAFHKKVAQPAPDNIHFVENPKTVTSLEELLKKFKGQKLYVDVWATWCGPCKTEFEHNKELKKLLKRKGINVLYISIDRPDREKAWNEMIRYYELEGSHIRAEKPLVKDLEKIFGNGGGLSIPWYMLIDENGDIVKKRASRPADLQSLENEISVSFKSL